LNLKYLFNSFFKLDKYPIDLIFIFHFPNYFFQLIPQLTHLAIADMGTMPIGLLHPFKQLRYLNISGNSLNNTALEVIDPCRELEVSHSQKTPGLGNNLAWNATHICPEIYCPASWTVGCLILSGQFVEYITVKHCGSTAAGVTPAPRYHYCN